MNNQRSSRIVRYENVLFLTRKPLHNNSRIIVLWNVVLSKVPRAVGRLIIAQAFSPASENSTIVIIIMITYTIVATAAVLVNQPKS